MDKTIADAMKRQLLITQYLKLSNTATLVETADFVDTLTNEERITVRTYLEDIGSKKLLRNLYYNYRTQEWV